eukprot:127910-Pleurochrysis_carterae.AAC.8
MRRLAQSEDDIPEVRLAAQACFRPFVCFRQLALVCSHAPARLLFFTAAHSCLPICTRCLAFARSREVTASCSLCIARLRFFTIAPSWLLESHALACTRCLLALTYSLLREYSAGNISATPIFLESLARSSGLLLRFARLARADGGQGAQPLETRRQSSNVSKRKECDVVDV